MAVKSEHVQSTAEHDSSPDRAPVEKPQAFDAPSFDLASETILKATPPDPDGQAATLRRLQGETRERLMTQFQQSFGNRYIQRVMDRVHSADQSEDNLSQRIQSASSSGGQLDAAVRNRLAVSLGADVSDVRVHTDQEADRLSREVSAIAFTTGSHIFFREGAYQPNTLGGQRLIAHEAVHTLQQASGPVDGTPTSGGVSISDPADNFEQAAEHAADAVLSGQSKAMAPASAASSEAPRVQRAFWNGNDLENDFWGTKQVLGQKWGGVADAGISAAWNLGGVIPGFGTAEGLVGAGIDGAKSLTASGFGAYHTATGDLDSADADMKAAGRFGHDMELSAMSAIPIYGTGQGAVTGLWDAASAVDRATGGETAPLSGDIWDQATPL
jgi:Domain of unknown function (DUF4157)